MTRDPAYPPQEDQRTMRSGEGQQDGSDVDDSDIYRGTPPAPSLNHASSLDSLVSSSSSESFFGRGRLGVLAAVVELAITRWARRNSLSSSSSSDSSSVTLSRSQRARLRKCRSSVATLQTVQSERDFAARINRIKAREESRQTPREFALYLPPSLSVEQPRDQPDTGKGEQAMRIIWTASLPLVLSQLDTALKRAAKARRSQIRTRIPRKFPKAVSTPHRDYMLPGDVSTQLAPPHTDSIPGGKAGKHKDTPASASPEQTTRKFPTKKAWFLDVASPTWEDMRAIGKVIVILLHSHFSTLTSLTDILQLLHLHPLTLEDILQRDPREKLELFPKLGYYFISFRAIEGRDARAKRTTRGEGEENDEFSSTIQDGGDDGVIGEGNVYLVVFNEGICTVSLQYPLSHIFTYSGLNSFTLRTFQVGFAIKALQKYSYTSQNILTVSETAFFSSKRF
jgi:magnesium transporter